MITQTILDTFPEILAKLENQELRDCLLMLADELPEKGASELRKMATRDIGLYPCLSGNIRPCWALLYKLLFDSVRNKSLDPARVPDRFIERELDKDDDVKSFNTKQQAWKFLLEKLINDNYSN